MNVLCFIWRIFYLDKVQIFQSERPYLRRPRIEELTLSNNQLECVPNVQGLRAKLRCLNVNKNRLNLCKNDTVYSHKLSNLKTILLDDNGLMIIPSIVLSAPKLQKVTLKMNSLKTLPNIFDLSPSLKTVDLNGNSELRCDCSMIWLSEIKNIGKEDEVKCKTPEAYKGRSLRKVVKMESIIDQCSYTTQITTLGRKVQFLAYAFTSKHNKAD